MDSLPDFPQLPSDTLVSDPLQPSLARQGQSRQVLALPWMSRRVRLGTCFRSTLAHTEAPFSDSPLFTAAYPDIVYRPSGTDASFYSNDSTTASASAEHLNTTLGVSAGCPILRASVTGQFGRSVLSNQDDCKTSVSASCRCGTVSLAAPPRLTDSALVVLKYEGGIDALKQRYGDYYVAAYVLGADAGALVSRSAHSASVAERLAITVKLKVLFWTASHTEAKTSLRATASSSVSVSAFSTLGNMHINETVGMGGTQLLRLAVKAKATLADINSAPLRVDTTLERLGVRAGEPLSHEVCDGLCNSGLVVELVLMPIETLREVQVWATSTDII